MFDVAQLHRTCFVANQEDCLWGKRAGNKQENTMKSENHEIIPKLFSSHLRETLVGNFFILNFYGIAPIIIEINSYEN